MVSSPPWLVAKSSKAARQLFLLCSTASSSRICRGRDDPFSGSGALDRSQRNTVQKKMHDLPQSLLVASSGALGGLRQLCPLRSARRAGPRLTWLHDDLGDAHHALPQDIIGDKKRIGEWSVFGHDLQQLVV